jgi:hypothetical protein
MKTLITQSHLSPIEENEIGIHINWYLQNLLGTFKTYLVLSKHVQPKSKLQINLVKLYEGTNLIEVCSYLSTHCAHNEPYMPILKYLDAMYLGTELL